MAFNSWFKMSETAGTATVYIYDEIGAYGISATDFIAQVEKLGPVDSLNLHINSPGGSVFDGWAIYNFLKTLNTDITVHIDGLAASMASILAMVGDTLVMPFNSMLMIHLPWTQTAGNENDLRKDADVLAKIKLGAIEAYKAKTSMNEADIEQMMIDETWLTASEAGQMFTHVKVIPAAQMSMSFDTSKYPKLHEQFEAFQKEIEAKEETKDGTDTKELETQVQTVAGNESAEIHTSEESSGETKTEGSNSTMVSEESETVTIEAAVELEDLTSEDVVEAAYDEGILAGKAVAEKEITMSVSEKYAKEIVDLTSQLAASHTTVFELSLKLKHAEETAEKQTKANDALEAKLAKLTCGLDFVQEDTEPETWTSAIESIIAEKNVSYDTAFVMAKAKYPDLYEAMRK